MEKDNKPHTINEASPENLQEIIKKIEADGERMLNELKNTENVNGESLTNLMKTGEKEFNWATNDLFWNETGIWLNV